MSRRRIFLALTLLGIASAVVARFVPLSYDEGSWLIDVRRWGAGESLYSDIPENKAPLLLVLVRALDSLPGSFLTARALYMGAIAIVLTLAVRSLAMRIGFNDRDAFTVGATVGAAAVLQAVFTTNFELPAATLLLVGLTAIALGAPMIGSIVATASTGFDIRALVLLPGVAVFALRSADRKAAVRSVATMTILAGAWIATILLVDNLRFALIDVNVATRSATTSWSPAGQLYAMLRGFGFPLAALLLLSQRRETKERGATFLPAVVLLVASAGISIASLQPFEKYWALALPGAVLLAASVPRFRSRTIGALKGLAALGLAVSIGYVVSYSLDEHRLVSRYERATRVLDASLPPGATFARFDTQPFLGVFAPERDGIPVAVLDYVIADTPRRAELMARVEAAISGSLAIVDDGALSVTEGAVEPAYRDLWRLFRSHLPDFPCVRSVEGLTVRYRASLCPEGAST